MTYHTLQCINIGNGFTFPLHWDRTFRDATAGSGKLFLLATFVTTKANGVSLKL